MTTASPDPPRLRKTLGLWDLVVYGMVLIQPVAPMGIFGIVSQEARGHVTTAVLIGMVAMLLTALSYGQMARAYPSAGSAFTFVGREIHPALGYVTGWSMLLDYLLNPVICVILCSSISGNVLPMVPQPLWVLAYAGLFTAMNLRKIHASAKTNRILMVAMLVVVAVYLLSAGAYLQNVPLTAHDLWRPFFDAANFSWPTVFTGASIACLTYIGFDGISTLSEEAKNPRRDILRATVLTCFATGLLAVTLVYSAQLVWGDWRGFPDVDTAFVHVAGKAGGHWLFLLVTGTLLVASIGSGAGAHLAGARLLYGMGQSNALPKRFFAALDPIRNVPHKNVCLIGLLVVVGGWTMSFQFGAALLNFGAFFAFVGVNLAAFFHGWLRASERRLLAGMLPLLGLTVCLYLWWSLPWLAKAVGGAWLLLGVGHGLVKRRSFHHAFVTDEPLPLEHSSLANHPGDGRGRGS